MTVTACSEQKWDFNLNTVLQGFRESVLEKNSCKLSRLKAVASHEQSGANGNKSFKLFLDRASSNPAFQLLKSVLKLLLKNPQSIFLWRFSEKFWTCNEQAGLVQQGVENLKSWKQKRFYCGHHHLNLYDKGRLSFNKSSIEWWVA